MPLVVVCDRCPLIHCQVHRITSSVQRFQWRSLSPLRLFEMSLHKPIYSIFPNINNIGNLSVLDCILQFGSVLQSFSFSSCQDFVQALQGPCTIFLLIQQTSNYVFITLLVHFISDHESGRVFNRLSNRTLRRFVALTTVSMILNISNPTTC